MRRTLAAAAACALLLVWVFRPDPVPVETAETKTHDFDTGSSHARLIGGLSPSSPRWLDPCHYPLHIDHASLPAPPCLDLRWGRS